MTPTLNIRKGSADLVRALGRCAMMALVLCTPAFAEPTRTFAVPQAVYLGRILPGGTAASVPMLFDKAQQITLMIQTNAPELRVQITRPDGQGHVAGSSDSGGVSSEVDVSADQSGAVIYCYVVNPPAGTWRLDLSIPSARMDTVLVLATCMINGGPVPVLEGPRTALTGQPCQAALAVFDGMDKVSPDQITATVFNTNEPYFAPTSLSFLPDADGLYGTFTPASPGTYIIRVDVTGTGSTGPYRRTVCHQVQIATPTVTIKDGLRQRPVFTYGDAQP